MRTAIITALTHDGKSVLLSGKEVPLLKQLERFNEARKIAILDGFHEKYREISLQENDGGEQVLTFRTPEAQQEYRAARAKEKQAHADQIADQNQREGQPRKAAADKAAADKAAADKAGNEFNREELAAKKQGELLAIADGLVKAGRIEAPAKTSPTALVEAILAAKPVSI